MSEKEIKLPEGITEQQMAVWKNQHGKLVVVNLTDEDGDIYACVFKRPNKDIMSAVSLKAKKDEFEAGFFMYTNCILAEDEGVKKDDTLKVIAAGELGEALQSFSKVRKNY